MNATVPAGRSAIAARRAGYTIAAVLDTALLYAVNVRPGWQAVPFLTQDVRQVLWLVNLSMIAGLVANMIYLVHDPKRVRYTGELVTEVIGLAVLTKILWVFPFAFDDPFVDWALITRTVLIVAAAGTAVAAAVNLVKLLWRVAERRSAARAKPAIRHQRLFRFHDLRAHSRPGRPQR